MKAEQQALVFVCIPESYPESSVTDFIGAIKSSASAFPFTYPYLPVGTIDNLMSVSEMLQTALVASENTVSNVLQAVIDVNDSMGKKTTSYVADKAKYVLLNFDWDEAKFPSRYTMTHIVEMISSRLQTVDDDCAGVMRRYTDAQHDLEALIKESTGSLQVQAVDEVVGPEHVVSTEWMTTRVVAVPRGLVSEWKKTYETMAEYVVPRSDLCLAKDKEYELHRVVLFTKSVDDFTKAARDAKMIVRNWTPDYVSANGSIAERIVDATEAAALVKHEGLELAPGWLEEAVSAAAHLTAVASFVEGVLRHGTPPQFRGVVAVGPRKKLATVLRAAEKMFGDKKSGVYDDTKALDGLLSFAEAHHVL
ncbi:ATPase, V1 complex, subunit C [Carpediemonas membranifera]|uniref:V-type proton ATPase subunit C n=1 Tax=Carpediemonas membranifera TaxID=201153 RepID=A0A8J6AUI9_9EUKA|nr:ATPase, V1 complex, subunit C [Carpediemonas membranifera]|eukprot:KAG9392825.1 ATPase, V1 complex, subunit C [Carpediemonas membranifera]